MNNFYPDEIIDEVRSSSDIVEIVSEYVHIKKGGRNYLGVCPFHNEKTPSFSVSPDKQIFYCFGCGAGGNTISFLMKIENIGFVEAIQSLAKRARIELPQENVSDEIKAKNELKEQIYNASKEAARFFYDQLMSEKGTAARMYLNRRGIDIKTIKKFGLGYAPLEWSLLNNHLLSKGFSQENIYKAGLAIKSKKDTAIDVFRDRVMFPIFDISSKVIAFGGRTLTNTGPKYLNSSETLIFNKSRNLYALNIAKNSGSKRIIIVEGYMDVITLHQYGLDFAVASLGTALAENQAKLLNKYAEEVIVAYDSDAAGQAAAQRNIDILNTIGCNVRVLQLTEEKDPDEYVRKNGIDKFLFLVNNSRSHIQFKIDNLKQQVDIKSIDGKIKFLNKMSDILAKVDNTIERDAYIRSLAMETGISVDSILAQVNKRLYGESPRKTIKSNAKVEKNVVIVDKKLDSAEKILLYLIGTNHEIYKKFENDINNDLFSNGTNINVASKMIGKLSIGQLIEPGELMIGMDKEQQVNDISEIFSQNIVIDDIEKASLECINYIKDYKKNMKVIQLLSEVKDNPEKLRELDQLIKNNIQGERR